MAATAPSGRRATPIRIAPFVQPAAMRRAAPRLQVNGRMLGELESTNLRVRVRDIGLDGFSIETMDALEPGLHVVRFTHGPWSISLSAEIRHAHPFRGTDGVLRHVVAFEYADAQSPDARQMIEAFVERLTSVLVFE